jgi:redox-sensitive bicupin YhaK (pirin superfamily)
MTTFALQETAIQPGFATTDAFQYYPASTFPTIHPVHWLNSHFAVGGWSPLQRLSGMLTAHMTRIAPRNGFTWHPHRGLEIYTWMLEGRVYHEDTTGGKGILEPGDLQRMFSGDYIEHQELNPWDEPARVIQIWFIADREHRGLEPHYQQLTKGELPVKTIGDASVYSLIGEGSPMKQHMTGRLTATSVPYAGLTTVEAPHADEDLFLYVTDGTGTVTYNGEVYTLGQYDVILARPDLDLAEVRASDSDGLHFLSFYLPAFLQYKQ